MTMRLAALIRQQQIPQLKPEQRRGKSFVIVPPRQNASTSNFLAITLVNSALVLTITKH